MRTLDLARRHASRHIATPDEYRAALAELDRLTDRTAPEGTPERDWVELLATLVSTWEDTHDTDPISFSTPPQVVEHMLEARGLTRADLSSHMGGRSRVSDFFAGNRRLSTSQVLAIRDLLHIPADVLLAAREDGERRARTVAERSPAYSTASRSARDRSAAEPRESVAKGGVRKRSPKKSVGGKSSKRTT